MTPVQRIPCAAPPTPGSTFHPRVRFTTGGDDPAASVVFGTAEVFERQEYEYLLARPAWHEDALDHAVAVVTAAVAEAASGDQVHFLVQATQANTAERLTLAAACGLRLFQEKEGFWWPSSDGIAEDSRLATRSLSDSSRDAFADVVRRSVTDIGDRVDQRSLAAIGGQLWSADLLNTYASGANAGLWRMAFDPAGDPVGFVGLAAGDGDGTIVHIGVVPEQRGHGYGADLVAVAKGMALDRGWRGLLSLVDVENLPMVRTMHASGFSADEHPWHKWHFVRQA